MYMHSCRIAEEKYCHSSIITSRKLDSNINIITSRKLDSGLCSEQIGLSAQYII